MCSIYPNVHVSIIMFMYSINPNITCILCICTHINPNRISSAMFSIRSTVGNVSDAIFSYNNYYDINSTRNKTLNFFQSIERAVEHQ